MTPLLLPHQITLPGWTRTQCKRSGKKKKKKKHAHTHTHYMKAKTQIRVTQYDSTLSL